MRAAVAERLGCAAGAAGGGVWGRSGGVALLHAPATNGRGRRPEERASAAAGADGVVADAQPPGDRTDAVALDDDLRGPRPS